MIIEKSKSRSRLGAMATASWQYFTGIGPGAPDSSTGTPEEAPLFKLHHNK